MDSPIELGCFRKEGSYIRRILFQYYLQLFHRYSKKPFSQWGTRVPGFEWMGELGKGAKGGRRLRTWQFCHRLARLGTPAVFRFDRTQAARHLPEKLQHFDQQRRLSHFRQAKEFCCYLAVKTLVVQNPRSHRICRKCLYQLEGRSHYFCRMNEHRSGKLNRLDLCRCNSWVLGWVVTLMRMLYVMSITSLTWTA